jgi:hypothetical protein
MIIAEAHRHLSECGYASFQRGRWRAASDIR